MISKSPTAQSQIRDHWVTLCFSITLSSGARFVHVGLENITMDVAASANFGLNLLIDVMRLVGLSLALIQFRR